MAPHISKLCLDRIWGSGWTQIDSAGLGGLEGPPFCLLGMPSPHPQAWRGLTEFERHRSPTRQASGVTVRSSHTALSQTRLLPSKGAGKEGTFEGGSSVGLTGWGWSPHHERRSGVGGMSGKRGVAWRPEDICVYGDTTRRPQTLPSARPGDKNRPRRPRRALPFQRPSKVTDWMQSRARTEMLFIECACPSVFLVHVPNRYLIFKRRFQPTHPPAFQGLGVGAVRMLSPPHKDTWSLPQAKLRGAGNPHSGPAVPHLLVSLDNMQKNVAFPPNTRGIAAVGLRYHHYPSFYVSVFNKNIFSASG